MVLQSLGHSNRPITLLSSVGSFSQPAVKGIKTLQNLLQLIQPLNLQRYDEGKLQDSQVVGGGISYKVYRAKDTNSRTLVAIKKVKLPAASANLQAFRSRISCILKDIELLSHLPLAHHANILNILGYGWGNKWKGATAIYRNRVRYFRHASRISPVNRHSAKIRRELCYQTASGLHELHLSGIAHGDLKLENILVVEADSNTLRNKKVPVIFKLVRHTLTTPFTVLYSYSEC